MELTYTKVGDYLMPDLMPDEMEQQAQPLGKYGMLRETFLQEHHHGAYTSMLLTGRLYPHLREIDLTAQTRVDTMLTELMKRSGVDEKLKASDQIKWVQEVNSLKAQAEETVLSELIYNEIKRKRRVKNLPFFASSEPRI